MTKYTRVHAGCRELPRPCSSCVRVPSSSPHTRLVVLCSSGWFLEGRD